MSNSELSLNFGISHGEFYYCKSNNFLQEEKRESVTFQRALETE